MGTEETNEQNYQLSKDNNAFNSAEASAQRGWSSDEARINRAFAESMSNTTWQRGKEDMMAAGFNPMLAYRQGGASSPTGNQPSGASATAQQAIPMQNPASAFLSTAIQAANIDNIQADTENKRAELAGKQGSGQLNDAMVANLRSQTMLNIASTDVAANLKNKIIAEVNKVIAEEKNIDAQTLLTKVNTVLQKHDIPRMSAEDAYFKTPVGKTSPHNKYGPQTPFRLLEGLGERMLNKWLPNNNQQPSYKQPSRFW